MLFVAIMLKMLNHFIKFLHSLVIVVVFFADHYYYYLVIIIYYGNLF